MRIAEIEETVRPASALPPDDRSTATTLINNAASGSATGIDTRPYDTAMVMVELTSISSTGTLNIGCYTGVSNADSVGITAITGASFTQLTNSSTAGIYVGRIKTKNHGRYLYIKAVQAGAFSKKYDVKVLLSKADSEPVAQANTVEFTV